MIVLLVAATLALAQPAPTQPDVPKAEPSTQLTEAIEAPEPTAIVPTATAEDLLHTAVDRMGQGDHVGARLLLDQAVLRSEHPDIHAEATYIRANTHALAWETPQATALYKKVFTTWPEGHRALDARFRHAHMVARIGNYQGAIEKIESLGKPKHFEPSDRAKLELSLAVWSANTHKPKKARKNLRKALQRTEVGSVAHYEARAWTMWATSLLDEADAIELGSKAKKIEKAYFKRNDRVMFASELLRNNVSLKEPEWILAGVLRLAESYENLADDLVSAPVPAGLDEAEYRAKVKQQVLPIRMNALKYLDKVREMSVNLQLKGPRVQELDARYEALLHSIRGAS